MSQEDIYIYICVNLPGTIDNEAEKSSRKIERDLQNIF